jgi:hypothetical protein
VLERALEDWWNCDPGTCFCTRPGKHPEPAIVPEGSVTSQQLVLDMSQRSSYLEIDRIETFLDCHEGTVVTRSELKELDDLERALIRQWKYVRRLVTSEGPDNLTGSDNLISALGLAVGDALRSSK